MTACSEARAVSMQFGAFTAVDAMELAVDDGEVVGLLGANGAGKTTLIRLLLGLLQPSSGAVRLFGSAPSRAGRERVGYVSQSLGLYDDLTVRENWAFSAAAFHTSTPMPAAIAAWGGELVGRLSLGAQRQVAFAVALAHRPQLLVLDEPTSGVGPLGRARLWEQIRAAADGGAGVLVTTHNLEEAEQCDRLVVMVDGKAAARGTTAEIIGSHTVVEVRAGDWRRAFAVLDGAGIPLQLDGEVLRAGGGEAAVAGVLAGAGLTADLREVAANFEEAFVAVVSGPAAA